MRTKSEDGYLNRLAGVISEKPTNTETNSNFNSIQNLFDLLGREEGDFRNDNPLEYKILGEELSAYVRQSAYMKVNFLKSTTRNLLASKNSFGSQKDGIVARRYRLVSRLHDSLLDICAKNENSTPDN